MVKYPELVNVIRGEIIERIKRAHKRRVNGLDNTLRLNVYASKDRKKSSIKCLKDKLRYLQGDHMEKMFSLLIIYLQQSIEKQP